MALGAIHTRNGETVTDLESNGEIVARMIRKSGHRFSEEYHARKTHFAFIVFNTDLLGQQSTLIPADF